MPSKRGESGEGPVTGDLWDSRRLQPLAGHIGDLWPHMAPCFASHFFPHLFGPPETVRPGSLPDVVYYSGP